MSVTPKVPARRKVRSMKIFLTDSVRGGVDQDYVGKTSRLWQPRVASDYLAARFFNWLRCPSQATNRPSGQLAAPPMITTPIG